MMASNPRDGISYGDDSSCYYHDCYDHCFLQCPRLPLQLLYSDTPATVQETCKKDGDLA